MNKYYVKSKADVDPKKPGKYIYPDTTKAKRKFRVVTITGPGQTEQAHKKECDMNYILRNYHRTGLITHAKTYEGQYDDVSVQDFQEAMFLVDKAKAMYGELPSNIREQFAGPQKFLEFVNNPENRPKMQEMGILPGVDGKRADGTPSRHAPASEPTSPQEPSAEPTS